MVLKGSAAAKGLGTHPNHLTPPYERGQALVEYALGLVLVGMVAMVGLIAVGPAVEEVFCDAIYVLNPSATGDCASLFNTPKINKAKYNSGTGQVEIVAKAPYDCTDALVVQDFGVTMERAGSSNVFKASIPTGSPPPSVTVGSASCGWSTVPLS